MFSGIVETSSQVKDAHSSNSGDVLRIVVERPSSFDDLELGHSICTNGVCLTVESLDSTTIGFALGKETLQITGWSTNQLKGRSLNLERSLKLGDRIHGHFVTGHVDGVGQILDLKKADDYLEVSLQFPESLKTAFWKKGSVCIDGVSLTINDVKENTLKVGLIPETLRLTNLKDLKVGQTVNLEVDFMSRALMNYFSERFPNETSFR